MTLSDLWIVDKSKRLVPLAPNEVQSAYLDMICPTWRTDPWPQVRGLREIALKARREGMSTLIDALIFLDTINIPNTRSLIMAHDLETAEILFEMVTRFHVNLPEDKRRPTPRSNRREMYFSDIDSRIFVGTAGRDSVGRGTTLNNIHASERAWWKVSDLPALDAGLFEALVPTGNAWLETTANGRNHFHEDYKEAKDGDSTYAPRFFGWPLLGEYRTTPPRDFTRTQEEEQLAVSYSLDDAQLQWRRQKKRERGDLFEQEYPINDQEAFLRGTDNAYFHQGYLLSLIPNLPKPHRIDRPGDPGYALAGELYTVEPPITHDTWQCRQWDEGLGRECGTIFPLQEASRVNSVMGVCCPRCGRPAMRMKVEYVIGVDCCGGIGGMDESNDHDWHDMEVFRRDTWRQVACYHGRCDLARLGRDAAKLGKYYNMADILVEQDPRGYGLKMMEEMILGEPMTKDEPIPYPNVRHWNAPVQPNGTYRPVDRQYWGYVVTTKSKLLRDSKLQSAILAASQGQPSIELTCPRPINQMLSYVDVEGERGADGTGKDDAVTGVGLAHLLLCGHHLSREAAEEDRAPVQAGYGQGMAPGQGGGRR